MPVNLEGRTVPATEPLLFVSGSHLNTHAFNASPPCTWVFSALTLWPAHRVDYGVSQSAQHVSIHG